MEINIAICDDDFYTLKEEEDIVASVLDEKKISYSIDTFTSPQNLLDSGLTYQIVILDVEMGSLNGIHTAEKIREFSKNCLIFFVTNYDVYMDDALNQHAFRFWTKPLDRRKLSYGLESAIKELNNSRHFITVMVNNEKIPVILNNIIYIFVHNKKLHVVTIKGEIITNDTLDTVMKQLRDFSGFFEPHRGYIVNFKYVVDYDKDKIYSFYKDKSYEIYLSRRKYEAFQKSLAAWAGGM